MAVRAWRLWGISTVLAGGMIALAQTPKSEVNGRATAPITQDHFQAEPAPPKLLPQQVREGNPSKTAPPTAVQQTTTIFGLQAPGIRIPTPDLDIPIRAAHSGPAIPALGIPDPALDWKARAALDIAEMHFDACDLDEARNWYQEVIKLAPGTEQAATAAERLNQTNPLSAVQSFEPPLAIAAPPTLPVRIP